jgi:hypothetical protein
MPVCVRRARVGCRRQRAGPCASQQAPGHCPNDDPQSFRVAVPYFTYQVKADKKLLLRGSVLDRSFGI